jgi:hypothetical protein
MGNSRREPAAGYTMSWAANRGKGAKQVVKRRKVTFPAATGARPEPFSLAFNLDTPFAYQGKALLVEFITRDRPFDYREYWLDAVRSEGFTRPAPGLGFDYGLPCPAGFELLNHRRGRQLGGLFYNQGYTNIPGRKVPVIDVIGVSLSRFGSLRLPLRLDFLGAPGCMLYTDIVAARTAWSDKATSTGYTVSAWGQVPPVPALVGSSLFSQWLALDPSYNAAGLAASAAWWTTIGAGAFQGACDCLHLVAYGRRGEHTFSGDEGAALYALGRAPVVRIN